MQHFTSLPDWYVAAQSRITTLMCREEWCSCVVLAMTSKPICLKASKVATGQLLWAANLKPFKLYATYSGVEQLSGKTKTMWNRSAQVEVFLIADTGNPDLTSMTSGVLVVPADKALFLECFQYVDNKARLGGACNICPTSKPLQRASSQPLASQAVCSMQHTQGWNSFQARRRQRGIVQL